MILNRKASFEYHFLKEYVAGIQLMSSEVKSLMAGNCNITESYCYVWDGEIFIKNVYIAKYNEASYQNHEERRDRKLLLHKKEIRDIVKLTRENGITIVPIQLYKVNGRFKFKIAVAKGKKNWDKRETIKGKDMKREVERNYKIKY
jgi:SsrA-binding protein